MIFQFIPNISHHTIEIPIELYGKEIIVEIKEKKNKLPFEPKSSNNIFAEFGSIKDFPTLEELRKQTSPNKW